jgi:hypothetical protein
VSGRVAAPDRPPEPARGAATLLLTRRLIEERTRRELPALAAARPVLRIPPGGRVETSRGDRPPGFAETGPTAGRAPRAAAAPAPAAAPPIDVERLTDQVVRRIDERIVAFRERMGKVF